MCLSYTQTRFFDISLQFAFWCPYLPIQHATREFGAPIPFFVAFRLNMDQAGWVPPGLVLRLGAAAWPSEPDAVLEALDTELGDLVAIDWHAASDQFVAGSKNSKLHIYAIEPALSMD